MTRITHKTLLASALTLGLGASFAAADIAEVTTEQGDVMTFEYEGDNLRINMQESGAGGYMLVRDGKMYVVNYNDGQPMVFDLGSAFQMFGSMATSATPSTVDSKVISLKATGASETLGGIKGDVYELRFIDHEGRERQENLVLSDDPLAIGFRDAIEKMARTLAASVDEKQFEKELKASEKLQQQLADLNKGVLRYGKDMQIRSIKDTTVDAQRFVLPAAPTDLGGMMSGIFGGGSSSSQKSGQSSGGLGSLFGGGSSSDKEEAPAEEEGTGSAAEGVGKAVGEAFGKLFGK
ncbi:hypothetical protein FV139_13805 [Parahaliea maris]|uniref:DUF4412 domain-containing protein n=1 Tax=Parahaliea maris TaxID=2716870 RepID=A0A5C8ZZS0_9GAMM|nr:hypothetical protein [Parahaliea maris]TXS93020.1 hypothetical protein FV139_13805 [Parahaliea maris]